MVNVITVCSLLENKIQIEADSFPSDSTVCHCCSYAAKSMHVLFYTWKTKYTIQIM
jgi:hypothetical protein